MSVEIRDHLGKHEVEIDSPLYGVMLIPQNGISPVMTIKTFANKTKATLHAETFDTCAVVVRINSTNA